MFELTVVKGIFISTASSDKAISTSVILILLIRLLWVILLSGAKRMLAKKTSLVDGSKMGASKAKPPETKVVFIAILLTNEVGASRVRKSG